MKRSMYLKDKIIIIMLNVLGIISVSLFMSSLGNSKDAISLLLIAWILVLMVFLLVDYRVRKHYFDKIYFISIICQRNI